MVLVSPLDLEEIHHYLPKLLRTQASCNRYHEGRSDAILGPSLYGYKMKLN